MVERQTLTLNVGGSRPSSPATYTVKKINKRMVIVQEDEIIYHMPAWVKIDSRLDLEQLADQFNQANQRCITAIMEFESQHGQRSNVGGSSNR